MAEAVQGMWQRNLGIVVGLENQEWKFYLKKLQNDPFPVFRDGWGADYPDPDNFMKLFTSNSGNNHLRWRNNRYDQLAESAARELREEACEPYEMRRGFSAKPSYRGAALLAHRRAPFSIRFSPV